MLVYVDFGHITVFIRIRILIGKSANSTTRDMTAEILLTTQNLLF